MSLACLLFHRGIVRIGGEDRRAFLQGLISNDIELCRDGRAIYAALLTPQGKFLHDLFIVEKDREYLIDCEAARAEDLLKRLKAYKLRAKVTFENAAATFDVWTQWNSSTGSASYHSRHGGDDVIFYDDPRLPELGARMIVKKGEIPAGIEPADFAAWDLHRLTLGVADGSRDMLVEKSTLPEGNFDLLNGISWTKGCYVGQELTARMHYRGLAKKRMFPVTIEGEAAAFGSIVKLGEEDIGDMRSLTGGHGLALLNVEKAEKAPLACGASKIVPSKLLWMVFGNPPA